jgi:hypothetical protein
VIDVFQSSRRSWSSSIMHTGTVDSSQRTGTEVHESSYSQVYSSKLQISLSTSSSGRSVCAARILRSTASDGSSAYIWSPSNNSASGQVDRGVLVSRAASPASASGPTFLRACSSSGSARRQDPNASRNDPTSSAVRITLGPNAAYSGSDNGHAR